MAVYKTAHREMFIEFLKTHTDEPFTVREITSALNGCSSVGNPPSESTVYRLLRELEKNGSVRKSIEPENREYVYVFSGENHKHINMRCKVCGNVYEADNETSRRIMADIAGCGEIVPDGDIELVVKCKHCGKE